MAWGTFTFRSMALNMPVEAEVLIPQSGMRQINFITLGEDAEL